MILLVIRTRPECQHHIYFVKPVPNPKNIHQVQRDISTAIPANQRDQVITAICSSTDDIQRRHNYQEVFTINEFVKALDNPDQFNQDLDHKVKHNSHIQKIRHR